MLLSEKCAFLLNDSYFKYQYTCLTNSPSEYNAVAVVFVTGTCVCDVHWLTADCSVTLRVPPYSSDMPANGLCDTRFMRCDRVIVYGDHFVRGPNLTCHFQECQVQCFRLFSLGTVYSLSSFPHGKLFHLFNRHLSICLKDVVYTNMLSHAL